MRHAINGLIVGLCFFLFSTLASAQIAVYAGSWPTSINAGDTEYAWVSVTSPWTLYNANVFIQVYDANGKLAATQSYSAQYLGAYQSVSYQPTFASAGLNGTYSISIGIYSGDWSQAYFWQNGFSYFYAAPAVQAALSYSSYGSGTTYYVSPWGSDGAAGTSPGAAWQSINRVNQAKLNGGDSVLFSGGSWFYGCLSLDSSHVYSSASSPLTVGSYGSGRATLVANCWYDSSWRPAMLTVSGVSGVTIQDLQLLGNYGGTTVGIKIVNPTWYTMSTIKVQNCDVTGFYSWNDSYGSEIFIDASSGLGMDGIQILNNTLHGSEVTSPDENGINGFGNGKNIKNVLYQGNLIYYLGGHTNGLNAAEGNGIIANGVDGGVIQYNIAHDIGANANRCGGGAGIWAWNSNNVKIQFNEAYFVRPVGNNYYGGCDWNGFDLDADVTNSVLQYNYSHDNFGSSYLLYVATDGRGWGPNVVRFNIGENDHGLNTDGVGLIGFAGYAGIPNHVDIYNNTIYNTANRGSYRQVAAISFGPVTKSSGLIANNIFYSAGNAYGQSDIVAIDNADPSGFVWSNNGYFGDAAITFSWWGGPYYSVWNWGLDHHPQTGYDPGLVSGGTTGVCNGYSAWCGTGYKLQGWSALNYAGVNPWNYGIDPGTQDFFGNTLNWYMNIGAY